MCWSIFSIISQILHVLILDNKFHSSSIVDDETNKFSNIASPKVQPGTARFAHETRIALDTNLPCQILF